MPSKSDSAGGSNKVMPMPERDSSAMGDREPPVFTQSGLGRRHPCGKLNLEMEKQNPCGYMTYP